MAFEVFGMKVEMELVLKNLKEIQNKIKSGIKDLPGGISEGAFGGMAQKKGGAAFGGMGKMLGKMSVVTGAALIISEGIKKVVRFMTDSSPRLKGIVSMFQRATMNFFRPFGDALASALKPAARATMKASVAWLEFTRKHSGGIKLALGGVFAPLTGSLKIIASVIKDIRDLFPGGDKGGGGDIGDLPENVAEDIMNAIRQGESFLAAVPENIRAEFIKWVTENKKSLSEMPLQVKRDMIAWIRENKEELQSLAKEVNKMFMFEIFTEDAVKELNSTIPSFVKVLGNKLNEGADGVVNWVGDFVKGWISKIFGGGSGGSSNPNGDTLLFGGEPVGTHVGTYEGEQKVYEQYQSSGNQVL